jgi:putative membrane protein
MYSFFREVAALVLGILVATHLVDGIFYDNGAALAQAVAALGIMNVLVRPILRALLMMLSLPLLILTFGLASLLVLWVTNALLFYATDALISGFHITSFIDALWGALCVSVVWWLLNGLFEGIDEDRRRKKQRPRSQRGGRGPDDGITIDV